MSDHEPTVTDAVDGIDQPGERLDADKLPDEFPDRPLHAFEYGTTEREMAHGESLDGRLSRELPDVQDLQGDDLQAEDDEAAATTLLDDADEDGEDREHDMTAELSPDDRVDDSGRPSVPRSAEESAMRIEASDEPEWDEEAYGDEEVVEDDT